MGQRNHKKYQNVDVFLISLKCEMPFQIWYQTQKPWKKTWAHLIILKILNKKTTKAIARMGKTLPFITWTTTFRSLTLPSTLTFSLFLKWTHQTHSYRCHCTGHFFDLKYYSHIISPLPVFVQITPLQLGLAT